MVELRLHYRVGGVIFRHWYRTGVPFCVREHERVQNHAELLIVKGVAGPGSLVYLVDASPLRGSHMIAKTEPFGENPVMQMGYTGSVS